MSLKTLELNGKTAVVIGGTSGIGRAIAHGLAQAGAAYVSALLIMHLLVPKLEPVNLGEV